MLQTIMRSRQGLSPRVRGNRMPAIGLPPVPRSIPACAGEPPDGDFQEAVVEVYPRVCGGTNSRRCRAQRASGLSPRVRGNPGMRPRRPQHGGSIPACAGEPLAGGGGDDDCAVYPRVCGGTVQLISRQVIRLGLSPRVRGNRRAPDNPSAATRSIPACAGEPPAVHASLSCGRVYPRVCGGTACPEPLSQPHNGLSPRVRGNPAPPPATRRCPGSIPACAGEPLGVDARFGDEQVYPRVCGGTGGAPGARHRQPGLSPRVRGNRRSRAWR